MHIVPFATTFINFLISNVAFLSKDWVYVFYTGLTYSIINYIVSRAHDRPVYSMLHWKDYTSFLVVAFFLLLAIALHFVFTKLSHGLRKGDNSDLKTRLLV